MGSKKYGNRSQEKIRVSYWRVKSCERRNQKEVSESKKAAVTGSG